MTFEIPAKVNGLISKIYKKKILPCYDDYVELEVILHMEEVVPTEDNYTADSWKISGFTITDDKEPESIAEFRCKKDYYPL